MVGDWAEEGQPGSPPSDCRAQGRHVPSHPNAHVGRSSENRPRGNVGAAVHRSFSLCLGLNSDPAWPPGVLALQTSDAPGGWSENRRVGGGGGVMVEGSACCLLSLSFPTQTISRAFAGNPQAAGQQGPSAAASFVGARGSQPAVPQMGARGANPVPPRCHHRS